MSATGRSVQLIVMAKAPQPGLAKTRLIPTLGAEGAARLAKNMLWHTVEAAVQAGVGDVTLCVTPDLQDPEFTELRREYALHVSPQGEGDLGQRMARAFTQALQTQKAANALMIGTDAPALDAGMLRQAAQALDTHDAVFVPAADGGYALIGLRQLHPALFENMPWSTPQLMAQTRNVLRTLGLVHHELPPVHDVDEEQDLAHVPTAWLNKEPSL